LLLLPRSSGRAVSGAGAESLLADGQIPGRGARTRAPARLLLAGHREESASVGERHPAILQLRLARAFGVCLADHAAPRPESASPGRAPDALTSASECISRDA